MDSPSASALVKMLLLLYAYYCARTHTRLHNPLKKNTQRTIIGKHAFLMQMNDWLTHIDVQT